MTENAETEGCLADSKLNQSIVEDKTMKRVFVVYGFSVLAIFNCILSTLDYFIEQMPGYNPSFWVGLGLNLFVCVAMIFVLVYGHHLYYSFKNHISILLQIPLTLSLPLTAYYLEDVHTRFVVYVLKMMILGGVNSL